VLNFVEIGHYVVELLRFVYFSWWQPSVEFTYEEYLVIFIVVKIDYDRRNIFDNRACIKVSIFGIFSLKLPIFGEFDPINREKYQQSAKAHAV